MTTTRAHLNQIAAAITNELNVHAQPDLGGDLPCYDTAAYSIVDNRPFDVHLCDDPLVEDASIYAALRVKNTIEVFRFCYHRATGQWMSVKYQPDLQS